jgi:hypothetical protein
MSQDDDDSSGRQLAKYGGVLALGWFLFSGEIPAWTTLAALGVAGGGAAAVFYASKIMDLTPDPHPVRLVQVNASGDPLAGWSLSRDKWAETEVKWGPLKRHESDSEFQTFECYAFNPEANVAVGTWRRHSVEGSQMVGQFAVGDVEREIETLRGHLEPMARRGDELRARLPGIIRQLDYERSEQLNAALEPGRPGDLARRSIDDVVRDELPPECQPDAVRNGDLSTLADARTDDGDEWSGDGLELVVDDEAEAEAIEPAPADDQLMNDGGTT